MTRRKTAFAAGLAVSACALALGAAVQTSNAPKGAVASSHREAPLISNDPTADLTDLYAFPSPDKPGTVTLITNVIPIEVPAEGPNYYNLDDSARYRTMVDWNGDGFAERTWTLRTKTTTAYPGTFLYNIGPITSLTDPDLSVRQTWTLFEQKGDKPPRIIGKGITAPNFVGKKSFPNGYDGIRAEAITTLKNGMTVHVGPTEDPFFIDVGRIFDLLAIGGPGTDNLKGVNTHSISLQIPLDQIRKSAEQPVIGVWSAVDRQQGKLPFYYDAKDDDKYTSSKTKGKGKKTNGNYNSNKMRWVQFQRLGQPLINEIIIPRGLKDYWNTVGPDQDYRFEKYYTTMNKPGQFANALNSEVLKPLLTAVLGAPPATSGPVGLAQETGRADLSAILLRGFKYPNVGTPLLDLTFGKGDKGKPVDELRLNTAIPATPSAVVDRRGLLCNFVGLGGFPAITGPACAPAQFDGYPNGRRLADDVTDIQVAAVIGLPIDNLIPEAIQRDYAFLALGGPNNPAFPSTGAVGLLKQGADGVPFNDVNGGVFQQNFPFTNTPFSGNP